MYVLIGGAGLVGLSLAQRLVELGHSVAVIDIDPNACRYAREQVKAKSGVALLPALLPWSDGF